ncbi:MAG: hypothetical protein ACT4PJ_10900 [Gemmatimonadaceae bacterium]
MNRFALAALVAAFMAGCAPPRAASEGGAPADRNLITLEQVEAARVDNAYELVRTLHPMWLRKRGSSSIQNDGEIIVYLNDTRMGGPETLRQIETISITSIRFYDVGAANFKFGQGHSHGAIQVSTKVPISRSS